MPKGGLSRHSSCLLAASAGPSSPKVGLSQPSSYLTSAYTGPNSTIQWPFQAHHLPDHGLLRLKTSSIQPVQAKIFLPKASAGPNRPEVSLCRPRSCLSVLCSQTTTSVDVPPVKLLMAYIDRKHPQAKLIRPNSGHMGASAGPNQPKSRAPLAIRQLRQAPLLPPGGLFRPSSFVTGNGLSRPSLCILAASLGSGLPQASLPRPSCGLPASCRGPALPAAGCGHRPNSCLTATALDSAPAQLCSAAFVGPQRPEARLCRPSSGLTVASPGSAPALRRHLPLGPARASRQPLQAQVVPESASPGPAPASRRPLQARNVLRWAPPGPAPASRRPPQARNFVPSSSSGPPPASRWPTQPQLWLENSLCRPRSCLPGASPGPALASRRLPGATFLLGSRLPRQAQLLPPRWPV
ncbi:PREDICTED: LOW QUALITY PROTEIN: putative uncharacterized protein FLJ44672 [Mandrillus leucophaeus]|uniref:LOW QUALITY PROTEIN: putative uncharacterized protein FLJ44672 n=1 Tax=Mandrillus leucophaeus TaxID=9568 RepID=UPI0005F5422B|nr:PREDICTED: LOW QUALITY PROTEIN: putative uncharacterized protein FLJ44672 [Mandrillus leucophaeus]